MTHSHCLTQPKQMIEWILNKELHKNPELVKTFKNISPPLIRNYTIVLKNSNNTDPRFTVIADNFYMGAWNHTTAPSLKVEIQSRPIIILYHDFIYHLLCI